MRPLPIYGPSASALHLARGCVYPWTSGLWRSRPRESTPAARYGQAISFAAEAIVSALPWNTFLEMEHEQYCDGFACAACNGADREARALALLRLARWTSWQFELDDAHHDALVWDVEALAETIEADVARGQVRAEAGYAYDLERCTAREIHRGERALPGELRGWADIEIVTPTSVIIGDWKSGRGPIEGPEQSDQLRFLALCAAILHGRECAIVEFRRLPGGGELRTEAATLDGWSLSEVQQELSALARRLQARPEPEPGPWCQDCPIIASCPATEALRAAAIEDASRWLQPLAAQPDTATQAAAVWGAIARLETAAERMREGLQAALPRLGEVEIAPGVALEICEREGAERIVQTEQAFAFVTEEIRREGIERSAAGPDLTRHAIDVAFSRETNKGRLDAALRHIYPPRMRGRPAKVEAFFDRLRDRKVLKKGEPTVRIEARRKADS